MSMVRRVSQQQKRDAIRFLRQGVAPTGVDRAELTAYAGDTCFLLDDPYPQVGWRLTTGAFDIDEANRKIAAAIERSRNPSAW